MPARFRKVIFISNHARQQLAFRGAVEQEVVEAIQSADLKPADLGRLECRKDYPYERKWNGKHYKTKQVLPIFLEEETQIVVVTVYVYYS